MTNTVSVTTYRTTAPGLHGLQRNVAAVASRWQHCVRFDRLDVAAMD